MRPRIKSWYNARLLSKYWELIVKEEDNCIHSYKFRTFTGALDWLHTLYINGKVVR